MEIMKLVPVGKERLWGGRRLKKEFGKTFDIDCLGESWECSVHPDGECMIANGSFEGQTLSRVLKIKPEYIGTKFSGCFPILAKFIDANRQLSVQVHPGDEYARINEHDNGKTEMWYVLDADTVLPILLMKIFYVRQFWIRHWINTCKKYLLEKVTSTISRRAQYMVLVREYCLQKFSKAVM